MVVARSNCSRVVVVNIVLLPSPPGSETRYLPNTEKYPLVVTYRGWKKSFELRNGITIFKHFNQFFIYTSLRPLASFAPPPCSCGTAGHLAKWLRNSGFVLGAKIL